MKYIVLSYASISSGHKKASDAIKKALQKQYLNDISFIDINALDYFFPVTKRIILTSYLEIVKSNPYVWEYLYDNPKIAKLTVKLKELFNTLKSKRLKKKIFNGFIPDIVVCTHAFPCGVFSAFKQNVDNNLPLIGITTDFDIHAYWIYSNVSYYLVSTKEIADKLIDYGISARQIEVTGIPISPLFRVVDNKERIRNKLNIDNLPTILIMGGSYGLGPIDKIVTYLNLLPQLFQIIVVTGNNKRLYRILKKLSLQMERPVWIYGYVDNVYELMQASDILITKPGGLTSAESLACGLPMIIVNPIPGQEERNSSYLVKHGAAVKVAHEGEVDEVVNILLRKPDILTKMREEALKIARPDACMRTAEIIMSLIR
jgi:processive 1,2-diacylglycerol beta-glucosyltransferase